MLYIAVSTAIGLGTTILNNVHDVRNWHERTFMGDFFVRAHGPRPGHGLSAQIPESLGDEIRAIPGVTNVDSFR